MTGRGGKSDLFKRDPVSYRVDRRSALKMELRRALSDKLVEFLGDFSDETLVRVDNYARSKRILDEYVVVLLCNGKDQYQARDGLMDFLGDETDKFVAWLWDYMSRKGDVTEKLGFAALKCKRMELQRPSTEVQAYARNASSDNERPGKQLKHYADSQKDLHRSVIHEVSPRQEDNLHGRVSSRRSLQKKLCASVTEDCGEEEPPISSPRGPYSPYPDENRHYKRGEKPHSSNKPSRSFHGPRSEVVALGTNINTCNRETRGVEHSEKLPKLAVDRMDKELKPVRRNVWDRLGKPLNETNYYSAKERKNLFLPGPAARLPHNHTLLTPNSFLIPHAQSHFISSNLCPEVPRTTPTCNQVRANGEIVNTLKRQFEQIGVPRTTPICNQVRANGQIVNTLKRQFEQIESHLRASVLSSKPVGRISAKKRLGICLGSPQPLPGGNCFSSNMADEAVVVNTGLKTDIVSNAESASSGRSPTTTPTEEEALKNSDTGDSSQEAPSKASDSKVEPEEMKIDMQELSSKQAQPEGLIPDSETNPSLGEPSQMEDMDSRTVLVTNVHFGATKEAIMSHFAKCGLITKAIMLRDTITGKPKGAACVTFMQKESVEKAISLSGTSLFSRILKVMSKADAPAGLIEQCHQMWQQPHYLQLPPAIWNSPHCYPKTTHFQWRRETNPSVFK